MTLYLRDNQLTELPAEIGALPSLQHLYVENNQLTGIPVEIGALTSLRHLSLNNNHLTELPAEIGALKNNGCTIYKDDNVVYKRPRE